MTEPDRIHCTQAGESDRIVRYLAGELPEEEADAFEAHYFGCDECWAELRHATEVRAAFEGTPGQPTTSAVRERRVRGARQWWPLVAAATVTVVLLGTWQMGAEREAPALRGPAGALPVRIEVAPGRVIAAWPSTAAADAYRVRLFSAEGTLLLERETADTVVRLEPGSFGTREAPLYLEVVALDELRQVLTGSGLREIHSPGDPS